MTAVKAVSFGLFIVKLLLINIFVVLVVIIV